MASDRFQRARQPHQKAERRAEILRVAQEMLDELAPAEITLNALSRRLGLAKTAIYKYFRSREEILLRVLLDDIAEWAAQLVGTFEEGTDASTLELVATLAEVTAERPRMCLLNSVLTSVLVKNISAESAALFARESMAHIEAIATAMHRKASALTFEQYVELLQLVGVLVSGLYPDAHPSELKAAMLDEPAMRGFKSDFHAGVERAALLVARGLLVESGGAEDGSS